MTDFITDTIRELSGPVFRLIRRIVGDREEARDLTQDLFVRLLRRPGPIKGETKPYVMRAALNTALNARRDRKRSAEAIDRLRQASEEPAPTSIDPIQDVDRSRARVAGAVEQLSEKQREAVTLRFYGELTLAQIAAAMNISEGSVRVHLARGLQNLRTILDPILDKE